MFKSSLRIIQNYNEKNLICTCGMYLGEKPSSVEPTSLMVTDNERAEWSCSWNGTMNVRNGPIHVPIRECKVRTKNAFQGPPK